MALRTFISVVHLSSLCFEESWSSDHTRLWWKTPPTPLEPGLPELSRTGLTSSEFLLVWKQCRISEIGIPLDKDFQNDEDSFCGWGFHLSVSPPDRFTFQALAGVSDQAFHQDHVCRCAYLVFIWDTCQSACGCCINKWWRSDTVVPELLEGQ